MIVPFNDLSGESKIWIYQADRALTADEQAIMVDALGSFCGQWAAHGQALKTSFSIQFAQFVILSVDESLGNASGCSIDGSVHVLKLLQQQLGVNFFDRTRVGFLVNNQVKLIPIAQVKDAFATGILNSASITFNPSINNKSDWETNWLVPAKDTWLAKYLTHREIV